MSELLGNVLLSNRSVTLVTGSLLHYQMALALFVVSQAVAKNQPVAPVNWVFCLGPWPARATLWNDVSWPVWMHCRVRPPELQGHYNLMHPVMFETSAVWICENLNPCRVTWGLERTLENVHEAPSRWNLKGSHGPFHHTTLKRNSASSSCVLSCATPLATSPVHQLD